MELELHDLLTAEFEENGEGPNYDCWNLCREVYRRAGRQLPRFSDYIKKCFERNEVIERCKENDFIKLDRPELLAIVTFRLKPRMITHMGIVLDGQRFIHIRRKAGVAIERLDIGRWAKKIEGFYRYVANN